MIKQTRRNFFRAFGLGTAGVSVAAQGGQSSQMPGRPPSGGAESRSSRPSSIMAIAAHPADAFFAMGAPVAVHVQLGGKGRFLSLSLGEKGSSTIPPGRYG